MSGVVPSRLGCKPQQKNRRREAGHDVITHREQQTHTQISSTVLQSQGQSTWQRHVPWQAPVVSELHLAGFKNKVTNFFCVRIHKISYLKKNPARGQLVGVGTLFCHVSPGIQLKSSGLVAGASNAEHLTSPFKTFKGFTEFLSTM